MKTHLTTRQSGEAAPVGSPARQGVPDHRQSLSFLPMTRAELEKSGWDAVDVLIVSGDAYVDHPSFGAALIGRWLSAHGFRVGIVAQPGWNDARDIIRLGRPRLFAAVGAGALDSMLAHYTAFRKKRSDDAYTPGGRSGARPNRATLVYANLIRHAFPGLPVVIGGLEASMRRTSHYDFWSDKVRRSVLLDSKADLLLYGMAEKAVLELARRLSGQMDASRDCMPSSPDSGPRIPAPTLPCNIPGTAFVGTEADIPPHTPIVRLPSHDEIRSDPRKLMTAALLLEQQVHDGTSWAIQSAGDRSVVLAPPAQPLSTEELDALYGLPFARAAHPSYRQPIPAAEPVLASVTTHRGCAGGCSFCSLAVHQGRRIASRSASSIVSEVRRLAKHPDWRGSLTDIGGPSANMWGAVCRNRSQRCRRVSCLFPAPCPNFEVKQSELANLLRAIRQIPQVKHLRTASGVRHDLALRDREYLKALVCEFTGGQLKVAPEHRSDKLLKLMRKPPFEVFERFLRAFTDLSQTAGKEQFLVPYLISAFPGCTDQDMLNLAEWLKARRWSPQQVQCFIPLPGTVAAAMYHAGIDADLNPIPVAKTDADRLRQHRILLSTNPDWRPPSESRPHPPRPAPPPHPGPSPARTPRRVKHSGHTIKCGTKRLVFSVIKVVDSRMPIPAASSPTIQAPTTG